jgi:hypothetical protein
MHPFVALMRTYCIDYTNSHDQSLYDEIMEPDYVVHINGMDLVRDESYAPLVTAIFDASPGLGLVVHEFVLNGDRLCMRFSEHGAMPADGGPRLACWRGIGLYKWNGRRLTENYVEQDYFAMQEQLTTGEPHPLEPPHLDPWTWTEPVPANPSAEAAVRSWLEEGDLSATLAYNIDDSRLGRTYVPVLDVKEVVVNDLFSAGAKVPFHVTMRGAYRDGLGDSAEAHKGKDTTLNVAGIAEVGAGGSIEMVNAVSTRLQALSELTGVSPF